MIYSNLYRAIACFRCLHFNNRMPKAASTALHLPTRSLQQDLLLACLHSLHRKSPPGTPPRTSPLQQQDGSRWIYYSTSSDRLLLSFTLSPSYFSNFGSEIRLWITAMLNMFILAVLRDILALMSSLSLALSARYHFLNQAKPSSFYQASYHL